MLKAIANTFNNCFRIPELKSRILFTLLVLGVCRVAAMVRIPGLDGAALTEYFEKHQASGASVLGIYSMFTGGALEHCAVGALGIMPYISATIILQLLTAVIPTLSKLAREEGGRTKCCCAWARDCSWRCSGNIRKGFSRTSPATSCSTRNRTFGFIACKRS